MSEVLIRHIDEKMLKRIKDRAKAEGHSMQKELKLLLEQALDFPFDPTGTIKFPKQPINFEPVTPIKGKGIPASELLINDRR